jgi:hypothetical protein
MEKCSLTLKKELRDFSPILFYRNFILKWKFDVIYNFQNKSNNSPLPPQRGRGELLTFDFIYLTYID